MFNTDKTFSAAPQALGFIYQIRFALYLSFTLPETSALFIEGDDDLSIHDGKIIVGLGSLKHRAQGNIITNSSLDFWKSIRIWITRYDQYGRINSNARFYLFTTSNTSNQSFINLLFEKSDINIEKLIVDIIELQAITDQLLIKDTIAEFMTLQDNEQKDFLKRIDIIDESPRIDNIPEKIMNLYFGGVRREFKKSVYERLEGWWQDRTIRIMVDASESAISKSEIEDKLAMINDEYKSDNLPITFKSKYPAWKIDPDNDTRMFVKQLKMINISSERIEFAILDYFRAFEQRAYWAKEGLVDWKEIAEYENNLMSEWKRIRAQYLEEASNQTDDTLINIGKNIYNWSQNVINLNIREKVQEPYVIRGSFQILANEDPIPKVFWHPYANKKIAEITTGVLK